MSKSIILTGLDKILAFGQEVEITGLTFVKGDTDNDIRFELAHPIVVPIKEYTRDFVWLDEVQDFIIH